jgi:hypothetical protein
MKHYIESRLVVKWVFTAILVAFKISAAGQISDDWTTSEKQYYANLKALCTYIQSQHGKIQIEDSLIKKYILFDYVLNDTSKARIEKRIGEVNQLLEGFGHFVDSAGTTNLEAEPIRFLQNIPIVYNKFEEYLKDQIPYIFAYYNKGNANTPLGYLLFDPQSKKLVSWILLKQGRHYYFLIFNLI